MTSSLITRLREATEPSRELDYQIWFACVPGASRIATFFDHPKGTYTIDETRDASGRPIIVPDYTSFVTIALTLLPKKTLWTAGHMEDGPFARIVVPQSDGGYVGGYIACEKAANPAIAITICALLARGVE